MPAPPTPTPQEWGQAWDPVTRREYLVPPPEVEAQIREAFNALLACRVVEDQDDARLRACDLRGAQARVDQYAAPSIAEWLKKLPFVEIRPLAPEGTVRYTDHRTCTVARAALEFRGYVIFVKEQCPPQYHSAPCVVRKEAISDAPHGRAFLATLQQEEDGRWTVTEWREESLPQPPSSP